MRWQGRYVETFVADNKEVYAFLVKMGMPGIDEECARVVIGVNTGDASIVNEVVQAAYNPTAGQIALQAGGAAVMVAPVPGLDSTAIAPLVDVVTNMKNMVVDLIQSQTVVNGSMGTFILKLDHVMTAQTALEAKQAAQEAAQAHIQAALAAVQVQVQALRKKRQDEAEASDDERNPPGSFPAPKHNAPRRNAFEHMMAAAQPAAKKPPMAAPQQERQERQERNKAGRKPGQRNKNRMCRLCNVKTPVAEPLCQSCGEKPLFWMSNARDRV